MNRGNVQRLDNGQVHFGFDLDPEVDQQLQNAAARVADRDAFLRALNEARARAPDQLEVLQALYKLHCYRGELQQAEDIVFQSLVQASIQGGFDRDWQRLESNSADWEQQRGPARSFLYSLKALAFIRLRQGDAAQVEHILGVLQRLDPCDQVGAQVVHDLLEGVGDADDG